jgi:hypothetical protein
MFLIHWAVFWWTALAVLFFGYSLFTNTMGPEQDFVNFVLSGVAPIYYAYMIGPMLLFKVIDYVITGESTSYPDDRKR